MKSVVRKAVIAGVISCIGLNVVVEGTSAATVQAVQPQLPRLGDTSPDVTRLQQAIVARGFTLRGGITGSFNEATRSALRNLQKVAGLRPTGRVDARTAKFLGLGTIVVPAKQAPAATVVQAAVTVATPSAPMFKVGDRGETVRQIQQAMLRDGIGLRGGADGVFGQGTRAAVGEFQKRRGLPITGDVDQATMSAITAMAPAAAPAPAPVVAAPAPAAGITLANLPRRGETSENVRAVQNALIANGVQVKGGADGVFGAATTISITAFQQSRGLNASGALDAPTAAALGLIPSLEQLGLPQMRVFPMQGRCSFVDSWGEPRSGGRTHEGTDVIGARGLAIYAVMDGVITRTYSGLALGGNAIRLTIADGTYFYYSHLDSFAPGIANGTPVRAGQIIGYNGSTGNAGSPHLHFEIHPQGGAAINPFPLLKAIDGCANEAVLPQ